MGGVVASSSTQCPDGVRELSDGMAAPDVMQLRDSTVFNVLVLAAVAVQVTDGKHRAFGGTDEAPQFRYEGVELFGVLTQPAAHDREVIEVDVFTGQ